jgi:hypothetical protein
MHHVQLTLKACLTAAGERHLSDFSTNKDDAAWREQSMQSRTRGF